MPRDDAGPLREVRRGDTAALRQVHCAMRTGTSPHERKISCRLHDGGILGNRILRSIMRTSGGHPVDTRGHPLCGRRGARRGYRTRRPGGGTDRDGQIGDRRSGVAGGTARPTGCGRLHCPQRLRLMPSGRLAETSGTGRDYRTVATLRTTTEGCSSGDDCAVILMRSPA
ncbi:hypothetical protein SGM_5656 [Streptomyces griseoaurantiacus M045]|uniref:Uncharacterized protein n=1 Tax=Streptomyces griseoaurantiacus M045 TaxID=996637 RepID=F3NR92_9ACTN|nr:hypothetical protein SGM_5656 [Streptomyces griseoaurantiacus M045]